MKQLEKQENRKFANNFFNQVTTPWDFKLATPFIFPSYITRIALVDYKTELQKLKDYTYISPFSI